MKKWVSVILAALLLLSMGAWAEGGAVQPAEEKTVYYNAGLNYEVSYLESEFTRGYMYASEHDAFFIEAEGDPVLIVTSAALRAGDMSAFLDEALGGYGEGAVIGEKQKKQKEDSTVIESVQVQYEGVTNRFYLVYAEAAADEQVDALCITATFNTGMEETAGARFDALVDAIVINVPQTAYQGEGWQASYPAAYVAPETVYGKEGFAAEGAYLLVVESDIAPGQAADLLAEATGGYAGEFTVSEQSERTTESGLVIRWLEAVQDGRADRYYALWQSGSDKVYCLTASYPEAAAGLYGGAFDAIVNSFVIAE